MRDSFVMYLSFYKAIRMIPDEKEQLKAFYAICNYAYQMEGEAPEGVAAIIFEMAKPQIDASIRNRENGLKGAEKKQENKGASKGGKKGAKPQEPRGLPTNVNVNVNDNGNVNDNDLSPISTDLASYIRGIEQKRKELAND